MIVLDFWATWCGPCRHGLTALEQIHDWAAMENKSVEIYAVNQGESVSLVTEYWRQNHFTMPVMMDPRKQVGATYGAQIAIPITVLIHKGTVVEVYHGMPWNNEFEHLKADIEQFLTQGAEDDSNS